VLQQPKPFERLRLLKYYFNTLCCKNLKDEKGRFLVGCYQNLRFAYYYALRIGGHYLVNVTKRD
jgi:hypothetical protein